MATRRRHLFAILVIISLSLAVLEILTRVVLYNKQFDTKLLYSNGNVGTFNEELGWAFNPRVVQRVRTTDNHEVTYRTDSYQPNVVVYGFYWNDVQNNMSGRSLHTEDDVVIHKPVLDLDTNEYRNAERSTNDITAQYTSPGALQASLILASQSKFLRAAGRALKYNLAHPSDFLLKNTASR